MSVLRCLRLAFYQMTSGRLCLPEIRTEGRGKDRQTVETDGIKETDTDRGVRAAGLLLLIVDQAVEEDPDHLRGEDHLEAAREDGAEVAHLREIVIRPREIEIETLVERDHLRERIAEFRKNGSQSQLPIIQKILTCAR